MDNAFDSLFYQDHELIAGIDESGVSDIAGPLVAACVILPKTFDDTRIFEVNDSKKIPEKYRSQYVKIIYSTAIAFGIGDATAMEIDYLGKRRAIILAMMRAINACQNTKRNAVLPRCLLIDGEISLPTTILQFPIKDGDLKSLSIASASIIAKAHRDAIMHELHQRAPYYGWNKNKGAPCENHFRGIDQHGVQIGAHRTAYYPFVPNKNNKKDEKHWDWRRGLWRLKTMNSTLAEIGNESWVTKEPSMRASPSSSSTPSAPPESKPSGEPSSPQ